MIPIEGADYPYFDGKCSLIVKVISHQQLSNKSVYNLRVVRNLNQEGGCEYERDDEFIRVCPPSTHTDGLWGLVLEGENL